jgi:hypothetical protein
MRGGESLPPGWRSVGGIDVLATEDEIVLTKARDDRPASEGGLASDRALDGVELAFEVWLDAATTFLAKLHQKDREDQATNSYHLLCSPQVDYLAKHERILQWFQVPRGRWLSMVLSWRNGRLELQVDGRRLASVADGELARGYCFLGLKGGEVRLRKLRLMSPGRTVPAPGPLDLVPEPASPLPFAGMPLRNLLYHVWPVRGSLWTWNVEQLKRRIDLFNGRRIVGIVSDEKADPPEAVMAALEGHGCEFVVHPNHGTGEVVTFPDMLRRVASLDPDEVTLYCHAKGVKYGAKVTAPVRQWVDFLYRLALDDWPTVWRHLQDYAVTGSLRIVGRFQAHQNLTSWHYGGTFFWFRHARAFSRPVFEIPPFYGGVEVWPALHFAREETGCMLLDGLTKPPYNAEFWSRVGGPALRKWEARRKAPEPPPDLANPRPLEGHEWPRTEQKPEELAWWIETLLASSARRLLAIGVKQGGAEWHVARVFRQHGKDIEITGLDRAPSAEAVHTFEDAGRRFGQTMRLVAGDSSSPEVRRQLGESYDAAFIDGDHTYRGARADWEAAREAGARIVGFHDIVDSHWHVANRCCVSRLWSEIKTAHRTEERCSGEWGGIGAVWL